MSTRCHSWPGSKVLLKQKSIGFTFSAVAHVFNNLTYLHLLTCNMQSAIWATDAIRTWPWTSVGVEGHVLFSPHPWWHRTVSWRVCSGWEVTGPHRGCRALLVWAGLSGWWQECQPEDRRWAENRSSSADQGFDQASLLLQKERKEMSVLLLIMHDILKCI